MEIIMQTRGKYDLQKCNERSNSVQEMAGVYRSGVPKISIQLDDSDHNDEVNAVSAGGNSIRQDSFKKAISKSNAYANQLHGFPSHHLPTQRNYAGVEKDIRTTVDWSEHAISGDHLWMETSASGDFCYVGEQDCLKTGSRRKCSACKIVVHTACMVQLERINFKCKPTFRDVGIRNYRENQVIRHHWVHRRRQEGKCKQCGKGFQQKLFKQNDIIAISCSWCKVAYHNKVSCFMMQQIEEPCTLGIHAASIIPPTWIIRPPKQKIQGSFKSSQRKKKKVPTATLR